MRDYENLTLDLRERASSYEQMFGVGESSIVMKDAADAIEELVTAVRSVVHCKDCKWCHAGYCEKYDDLIPWGCANKPWEDWFCADGKRREIIKEAQDAD